MVQQKCRMYRQEQRQILLREICQKLQAFWKKSAAQRQPVTLPQPLQRQDQWQQ